MPRPKTLIADFLFTAACRLAVRAHHALCALAEPGHASPARALWSRLVAEGRSAAVLVDRARQLVAAAAVAGAAAEAQRAVALRVAAAATASVQQGAADAGRVAGALGAGRGGSSGGRGT